MGIANISIVGNVVRSPEQTILPNGGSKTTLFVAVNSFKKNAAPDTQTAEFYKVEAWGKLADVAYKYIPKGSQITAVGRFSIDRWQGRDGRDRAVGVINASELSLPPKRAALEDATTTDPSSQMEAYPSPPAPASTPQPAASAGGSASGAHSSSSGFLTNSVASGLGVEPDDFLSEAEEDAAAAEMYSTILEVPAGKDRASGPSSGSSPGSSSGPSSSATPASGTKPATNKRGPTGSSPAGAA